MSDDVTPDEIEARIEQYVQELKIPREEARRLVENELAE